MAVKLDPTDIPQVAASDLNRPMQMLIEKGQGLALLTGLSEHDLRELETSLWSDFQTDPDIRVAIALRLRALVDVFATRRLKDVLLARGFKVIPAAIAAASQERLNTHFGFNAQRLLLAIDAATAPKPQPQPVITMPAMQTAA
jgi:hypothetical protein